MLFNSIEFIIFFPLAVIFFYITSHRYRWLLLLIASYFFYMCWKPEYVLLIWVSTLVDYFAGLKMGRLKNKKERKPYLYLSLIINLGLLGAFKYLNFFGDSFNLFFEQIGMGQVLPEFHILLPLGITFYTFQTMSYSIDVYRGTIKPEKHLGRFALFVVFFPQLVAGPIERAGRLLVQFRERIYFNYENIISGLKLMLWGFFQKIVIADRLGLYVNKIYDSPGNHYGLEVIIATFFFVFQLYCDFAGYSNIAIGAARTMGYKLINNFNRPFIAQSTQEFWNRWHISLSTWFRDYVFFSFSLGRNKKMYKIRMYWAILVTFVLSGLWHSPNWKSFTWGALFALYIIFELLSKKIRSNLLSKLHLLKFPGTLKILNIIVTFFFVSVAMLVFRAHNINDSLILINNSFEFGYSDIIIQRLMANNELKLGFLLIIFMLFIEYIHQKFNINSLIYSTPLLLRWIFYLGFILMILFFGRFTYEEFYYIQF